jgi:hypothetical protein
MTKNNRSGGWRKDAADHWQKAYSEMADAATLLMHALCEIRDNADPYTHQIHWCRQTASAAIEKANAALRPKTQAQRLAETTNDYEQH